MGKLKLNHYKTISEFHRSRNLLPPEHPLISVIAVQDIKHYDEPINMVLGYYSISLKRDFKGKFSYGQSEYDFDEGLMYFISPNQVFKIEHPKDEMAKQQGWLLLIHPDFFWKTALAKTIKQYDFFDYSVNEALFLSDKEERVINAIIENIKQEYHNHIDKFSQSIIISQIETLFNYSERFYQRQFITRKIANHKILDTLENTLNNYFKSVNLTQKGLPTVQFISDALNISPNYLSSVLKSLTGQSTQQHIHDKLITEAKQKLSTSDLSISEIAYELGFEHSQSFSKLFKNKTHSSPSAFRHSFN
ncbi:Helix-turn-helix domain-containing protein [Gillisia sp. Hel1_33_143]|uniref:helix-turn-helix domain-containing protein n=1 Tax=Gillisia sp. Hel1_33_143 TaxID=1336796 RepID=UPI00087C9104|nr:helix-turn-helix transcriptional regulator [Gillisia sp. Hel1_33_143]SDR99178.1 Helix-turn-helix domain-containing protein [Gillisia sp. Hel1_33_143]